MHVLLCARTQCSDGCDIHGYLMERMDSTLTVKLGATTIAQRKYVLLEIARGLEYLHSKVNDPVTGEVIKQRALHRDLKSVNVLVSNDLTRVKLADFGLSRTVEHSCMSLTQGLGTKWYQAPEMLERSNHYGRAADVYSFGQIASEVLAQCPHSNSGHIDPPRDPTDVDVQLMTEVMQHCQSRQPEARPNITQVIEKLEGRSQTGDRLS